MMGQEHIRNIVLLPAAAITAIVEPDDTMRQSAQSIVRRTGNNPCQAFSTVGAFVRHHSASPCADVLVIATPNHTHDAILVTLADTGLPILVEKPLGISMARCRKIATRLRTCSQPVWVAMEYRYMPAIAQLVEWTHAGRVGKVHMLAIREHRYPFLAKVGNWNRFAALTGGTLVEKCCHFFDLMYLIMRSEPIRIYASGGQGVNHLDEQYQGRRADMIDNAFVVVDFASGQRASLDLCMFAEGSRFQETLSVTGDTGALEAFVPGPLRFQPEGTAPVAQIVQSKRANQQQQWSSYPVADELLQAGDHNGATFFQHQRFQAAVLAGTSPEVTIADGMRAVAMGVAAERSARTGRAIRLDSHQWHSQWREHIHQG